MNLRGKQNLVRIDIANSGNYALLQQAFFNRFFRFPKRAIRYFTEKLGSKGCLWSIYRYIVHHKPLYLQFKHPLYGLHLWQF